jgi:hypothetical protein
MEKILKKKKEKSCQFVEEIKFLMMERKSSRMKSMNQERRTLLITNFRPRNFVNNKISTKTQATKIASNKGLLKKWMKVQKYFELIK